MPLTFAGRFLCANVGNLLGQYLNEFSQNVSPIIEMEGDDIYVRAEFTQRGVTQMRGKASVSISCVRNEAVLGHLGINNIAGDEAPAFAYSIDLNKDQCAKFMIEVNNLFYSMTKDIWLAANKTI